MEIDVLLTTREAASMLHLTADWLRKLRYRREGPDFIRVGLRHIMYRRSDLIRYMRERTVSRKGTP